MLGGINQALILKYIQDNIVNIVIIIIISYIFFTNMRKRKLLNIKTKDGQYHLVRDLPDKKQAAKIMGEIKKRMEKLAKHVAKQGKGRLKEKFEQASIHETDLTESGTSYSVDKGKELSICMRNKDTKELHNINLLMFVCIHELAHLMSKSYGHNEEFEKNFKYLLKESTDIGIYQPQDYSKDSEVYCGMVVDHNPLF